MKPTLCLLLLLIATSCKKESSSLQQRIIGKWELRKTYRSAWSAEKDYPSGNGDIYEFTQTQYFRYLNGQLSKTGTYYIIKDTTRYNTIADRIVYDKGQDPIKQFISINDNRLNFSIDAADAGGVDYGRIQ